MASKTTVKVQVASSSNPAKTYTIWVGQSGPEFCECPAFKFQRGQLVDRKPCKHMRSIAGLTAQVA